MDLSPSKHNFNGQDPGKLLRHNADDSLTFVQCSQINTMILGDELYNDSLDTIRRVSSASSSEDAFCILLSSLAATVKTQFRSKRPRASFCLTWVRDPRTDPKARHAITPIHTVARRVHPMYGQPLPAVITAFIATDAHALTQACKWALKERHSEPRANEEPLLPKSLNEVKGRKCTDTAACSLAASMLLHGYYNIKGRL